MGVRFIASKFTSGDRQRERVLINWYRQQLKEPIPPLIAK